MAMAILPAEYQIPPEVSDPLLEDLIVSVDPGIEDLPDGALRATTAQLRAAVEKMLLGYLQSIFLTKNGASMLPAQHWSIAETIAANYRQAWAHAGVMPTVRQAFELFMANMDIEGERNSGTRYH